LHLQLHLLYPYHPFLRKKDNNKKTVHFKRKGPVSRPFVFVNDYLVSSGLTSGAA
jgi:hypothetical protein